MLCDFVGDGIQVKKNFTAANAIGNYFELLKFFEILLALKNVFFYNAYCSLPYYTVGRDKCLKIELVYVCICL